MQHISIRAAHHTVILFFLLLVYHTQSLATLITFDVDGTLVKGTGAAEYSAHSKAFSHAVETIFETPSTVPPTW